MSWRIKLKDLIPADKLRADKNLPSSYTIYEPTTARVVNLDDVQSFVIYEKDDTVLDMIAERGFKLEALNDNWWICRRCKIVK